MIIYMKFQLSLIARNKSWLAGGASGKEPICQCRRHERQVWSLFWDDLPEDVLASPFSILAWRIPWTEESGGLQSIGLQRVRHHWSDLVWHAQGNVTYFCTLDIIKVKSLLLSKFLRNHSLGNGYKDLAATAAKSLQSCPTLCDPIDGSPPGSPVPGILQARTLEWGAISFSNAWKWKVKVKSLSSVQLLATPWTAADQAPPSMGFSRQEYWSGVQLPSP